MKKKQILFASLGCLLALFLIFGSRLVKAAVQPLLLPVSVSLNETPAAKQITLRTNDYVVFGAYQGEPILWQVLRMEDGNPLLWSSRILCFKAFDASGMDAVYHKGTDYTAQGSNSWVDSTLRQWLNSSEQSVPWTHCPPTEKNVLDGLNPYADEPGFLTGFSEAEQSLLAPRNGDLVFLLSQTELSQWVPAAKRTKELTHTAGMKDRSSYLNLPMSFEWYWTSSPAISTRTGVTAVTTSGSFYKDPAYDGHTGVCPAVLLKSRTVLASGDGTEANPYQIGRVAK